MTLPNVGEHPRCLENVRIGGGYSSAPGGGADIDQAGNMALNGDLSIAGDLELEGMHKDWSVFVPAIDMWPAQDMPCSGPDRYRLAWLMEVQALVFAQNADERAAFNIVLPENYDGRDLKITLYWTASSGTAGTVYWRFYAKCLGDGDSLSGTYSTAPYLHDDFLGQNEMHVTSGTISPTNPSSGELAMFSLRRHGTDSIDTFDADALLVAVRVSLD